MRSISFPNIFGQHIRQAATVLLGAVVLALGACGGGGTTSDNGAAYKTTVSNDGVTLTGLRALPPDFGSRRAAAYGPYRTADRATEMLTVTDEQMKARIKEDMDLLVAGGIGMIRLFNSSENEAARILRVISANKIDMKVMLGVWINSFEYDAALSPSARAAIDASNADEIGRGVALANSYPGIVVAVSVGNETLDNWDSNPQLSTSQLAKYIKTVRDQITQPVTTDDNYGVYAGNLPHHPAANQMSEVLAQIDFASIHSYPILDTIYSDFGDTDPWPDWDWQQMKVTNPGRRAAAMMDAAINKTKQDYERARAYLDSKGKAQLPIIIGETGWKVVNDSGNKRLDLLASPANQKMYYDRLMYWADSSSTAKPRSIFYFEAFDEPWKVAAQDGWWGLFNVKREARFAIQGKNVPSATWKYEYKTGTTAYTEANAVFWSAPKMNTAISSSRYTLLSDQVTAGETIASVSTNDLRWDPFANSYSPQVNTDSAPGDGRQSIEITPNPLNYGWGVLYQSPGGNSSDLSGFDNGGTLHVSIKTSYTGKLEIGFSTDTDDRSGAEAFLQISPGDGYGYRNDGVWCDVSIPISAFKAVNGKLDLRYVLSRFMIADRYKFTGNTDRTQNTKVLIDNIYWSK